MGDSSLIAAVGIHHSEKVGPCSRLSEAAFSQVKPAFHEPASIELLSRAHLDSKRKPKGTTQFRATLRWMSQMNFEDCPEGLQTLLLSSPSRSLVCKYISGGRIDVFLEGDTHDGHIVCLPGANSCSTERTRWEPRNCRNAKLLLSGVQFT